MRMIRDALEYEVRTGRDPWGLSPFQISVRLRSLREIDRTTNFGRAVASAAGMGSEEAWKLI